MAVSIPESHQQLIDDPTYVVLTTMMRDGQPQSTVVWFDYDGTHFNINSAAGRQKDKNMRANSKVTLLAMDKDDPFHWIEVRGTIDEITEEGAVEHIDSLARRYTEHDKYYGGYAPAERAKTEKRVIYRIKPTKITAYPHK